MIVRVLVNQRPRPRDADRCPLVDIACVVTQENVWACLHRNVRPCDLNLNPADVKTWYDRNVWYVFTRTDFVFFRRRRKILGVRSRAKCFSGGRATINVWGRIVKRFLFFGERRSAGRSAIVRPRRRPNVQWCLYHSMGVAAVPAHGTS